MARGKFQNIVETVGDTPIVKINQLAPDHVTMWAKIEAFNPLGSVKDRLPWASSKRQRHQVI